MSSDMSACLKMTRVSLENDIGVCWQTVESHGLKLLMQLSIYAFNLQHLPFT